MDKKNIATVLRTRAEAALDKWVGGLDERAFTDSVMSELAKRRAKVMERVLGVDTSWSDIRLNRDGVIPDFIRSALTSEVRSWLKTIMAEELATNKDALEKKIRAAVRRTIKEDVSYTIERYIRDMVDEHVRSQINPLVEELLTEVTTNPATLNTEGDTE